MRQNDNLLYFNLTDAPNFTEQLRQAGFDPESLKKLPRLSTLGETTQ